MLELAHILAMLASPVAFVVGVLVGFTAGHRQGTRDAGVFREKKRDSA
jgi:ABC-type dipeptide/oligopeptide/nickel transport system permease subunit